MGQRHILHCDCNCFYASVEMQEHPELRGKSIAVCGDPEARHGIVLTASYPAKRMGVKTAMPIWEAKQHCRDLIVVPASYGNPRNTAAMCARFSVTTPTKWRASVWTRCGWILRAVWACSGTL